MEIKLTESEVLLLRMIVFRYQNELEKQIENNTYPEKYAYINSETALEAVNTLYHKIVLAELETYYAEKWGVDINE